MVRPVCMVDGSDNRTAIPAYGIRQALSKDTTLVGGNINIDFNSADTTDADSDGSTVLMEPNQDYLISICRLAEVALSQVIVCNINLSKDLVGGLQSNVNKIMIVDNPVILRLRLNSDQNFIRFRFLGMAVTDNIRVCVAKLS